MHTMGTTIAADATLIAAASISRGARWNRNQNNKILKSLSAHPSYSP